MTDSIINQALKLQEMRKRLQEELKQLDAINFTEQEHVRLTVTAYPNSYAVDLKCDTVYTMLCDLRERVQRRLTAVEKEFAAL